MSQDQLGLTCLTLDTPREAPGLPPQHGEAAAAVSVLGCTHWDGHASKSCSQQGWEKDKLEVAPVAIIRETVSAETREKALRGIRGAYSSSILVPVLPLLTQLHLHGSCPSTYSTSVTVPPTVCLLAGSTSEGQILLLHGYWSWVHKLLWQLQACPEEAAALTPPPQQTAAAGTAGRDRSSCTFPINIKNLHGLANRALESTYFSLHRQRYLQNAVRSGSIILSTDSGSRDELKHNLLETFPA